MDVKLIKIRDGEYAICTLHKNLPKWYKMGFDLENGYYAFGANVPIGGVSDINEHHKLSLKNCQAIERGYDLDELAMGYDLYENINFVGQTRAYKAGFQKALELMGDKRFSEEDVKSAIRRGYVERQKDEGVGVYFESYEEFIQSLQQTEWDVEIEMVKEEYIWSSPGEGFEDQTYRDWREVPKLDENGCLILKKK